METEEEVDFPNSDEPGMKGGIMDYCGWRGSTGSILVSFFLLEYFVMYHVTRLVTLKCLNMSMQLHNKIFIKPMSEYE